MDDYEADFEMSMGTKRASHKEFNDWPMMCETGLCDIPITGTLSVIVLGKRWRSYRHNRDEVSTLQWRPTQNRVTRHMSWLQEVKEWHGGQHSI